MIKSYIKNKRKIDRAISMFSLIFWVINFVFTEISINMLIKIVTASKDSWFTTSLQSEVENDPLLSNKTEVIVITIIVIMIAIMALAITTVVLFRNIQMKNMLTQLGVMTTLGYDKMQLYKFCMQDVLSDIIIAFPISIILSTFAWNIVSKTKVVSALQQLMNNHILTDVCAYVFCGVTIILVVMIHTYWFVNKSLKSGIRYMLGKGIV